MNAGAVRPRILVADDDPVAARFVATLLAEKGYEVLVAADGEHAFEIATRLRPDLIVSDLVMPYRDGFDVVRAIREHEAIADVPIVIVSMKDREEDIVRGLETGADDYVVKPFNARELLTRVRKLLARGGGRG
ncbi:MAG: response regulator [Acidobacteriia bacterium]|nr:response regulator [Terriglobia bacterium]